MPSTPCSMGPMQYYSFQWADQEITECCSLITNNAVGPKIFRLFKDFQVPFPDLFQTFYQMTLKSKKRKVLPKPWGPQGGADLHFFSPQPDTSLHCKTTDTGLVHRAVCLFTSQLSLVLIAPTHGGMARLSWPGYVKENQHLMFLASYNNR